MTGDEQDSLSNARTTTLAAAGDNLLVARSISEQLRRKGRLTFAEFMRIALYHPDAGYYSSADPAASRDYRTSPHVHPLFGALIALQLEQMWQALGSPRRFFAVEAGAGDASLCRDILSFTRNLAPQFVDALRYVIVEPHSRAIATQRKTVSTQDASRIQWISGSALDLPLTNFVGCFISNELVDAFPVHRVVVKGGVLLESYVIELNGALAETLAEPSEAELGQHLARLSLLPAAECLVEVNLCSVRFIQQVAAALRRGFLLTIDYGLPAEELYLRQRPNGTLGCYHRHRKGGDPFRALGHQDITAHVDFSALILSGRNAGLRLSGFLSQRDFLLNLGFEAFMDQLERADLTAALRYENRFAAQELISNAGLGAYRVLVQHKGLHDPELDGFNPCNTRKRLLLSGGRRLPFPSIPPSA